jgi:tyramine---L-glutamate ligase
MIVQEFVPGRAMSVALMVNGNRTAQLLPCEQRISNDGLFQYLGGSIAREHERIAFDARSAIVGLDGLHGFVGIDFILDDQNRVWFLEINPRLTTSYLGLRRIAQFNLAASMMGNHQEIQWFPDGITWNVQESALAFDIHLKA